MSLGVLNNINAVYAANNLNNTGNSLSKVLNELSSGSKINSGADDAAGLSLVNGLQANATALAQSQTNAAEGVGLLKVADGALSQVTNLLNRAVTLATEASNGTLNASQDTAANNEYQSILSEINNIGTTTTYNDTAVFGSTTNIYTGDSSTAGASINSLNIRGLSSSNVGDSNGQMAYNTGASGNNVFIDLTNAAPTNLAGAVASVNDTLNSSGTTSITITTLSSTGTDVDNTISVGGTSGYANTAQGLISAINNSGLGVTASFTTAAVAGDTTSGTASTDTGIMITGSVGSGTNPSQSSYSGVVAAAGNDATVLAAQTATGPAGAAASAATIAGSDIMSGSITLQVGNNAASTVTTAQVATANSEASGAVTMKQLASYITANAGLGVTATVDSSTGALKLSASNNSTAALKVTSNLTDNTLKTSTAGNETTSYTATSAYSAGLSTSGIKDTNIGNATLGTATASTAVAGYGAATVTDPVGIITISDAQWATAASGTLSITDGTAAAGTKIFTLGSVSDGTDTLANLANTINAAGTNGGDSLGYTASYSGGVLTITQTGSVGVGGATTPTNKVAVGAIAANTGQAQTGNDAVDTAGSSTTGGTATISYTDAAGVSLSGTDLSNQADAQASLTALNKAITAVAAQDGYIGAQINTLNAVSSVLSTQAQNVVSAQNAVQATDYATATSDMSKYEILSQTGISALAQANSMQQEVTKLLQ
jgi:flagellin